MATGLLPEGWASFLGLLDKNVQAINKAENNKSAYEKLLATARILLSALDYKMLEGYEKAEIEDLFGAFAKVAEKICDFYQKSKVYLDPEVLNGELGQSLERTTKELADKIALIGSIEKNNAALLEKEDELNQKNAAYKVLAEKVAALKEIQEKITEEKLTELKREHEELDLHFGENSKIVSKLKEYGVSSIDNALKEIDRCKEVVKTELEGFDNILKAIITDQEGEIDH